MPRSAGRFPLVLLLVGALASDAAPALGQTPELDADRRFLSVPAGDAYDAWRRSLSRPPTQNEGTQWLSNDSLLRTQAWSRMVDAGLTPPGTQPPTTALPPVPSVQPPTPTPLANAAQIPGPPGGPPVVGPAGVISPEERRKAERNAQAATPPRDTGNALDERDAQGRTGDQRAGILARGLGALFRRDGASRESGLNAADPSGAIGSSSAGSGSSGSGSGGLNLRSAGGGGAGAAAAAGGFSGGSPENLQLAQTSGMGQPFRDMGLTVGRGPGGQAAVLRADGSPAPAAEVAELRRRLDREPLAAMQRPDFYKVLPRAEHEKLRQEYAGDPSLRGSVFKDVAATPEVRDFQWSRTCSRLDGNCNPNAMQGRYDKGRYVAPEDLKSMSTAIAKEGGAAKDAKESKDGKDAKSPERAKRSKEFWDQLQKEDQEFQRKLEQEQGGRNAAPARSPRGRLGALLDALASSLSGGGGEGEEEGVRRGPDGLRAGMTGDEELAAGLTPDSAAGDATPGRLDSDLRRMRRMPDVLPLGSSAGQARRVALAGLLAALGLLLAVYVRRRR